MVISENLSLTLKPITQFQQKNELHLLMLKLSSFYVNVGIKVIEDENPLLTDYIILQYFVDLAINVSVYLIEYPTTDGHRFRLWGAKKTLKKHFCV